MNGWRAVWRWLTGRAVYEVPEHEPFDHFQVPIYHPDWRQYGVTMDVLSDDFYEQVSAQRAVIDTLHDSTMMARIDKGEQAEAGWPWWLDYSGSAAKPWICPDAPEPDPYVWHDVGTLVDMANEVGE